MTELNQIKIIHGYARFNWSREEAHSLPLAGKQEPGMGGLCPVVWKKPAQEDGAKVLRETKIRNRVKEAFVIQCGHQALYPC